MLWILIGDVLFGIIYIPPEGSVYADPDIFKSLSGIALDLLDHLELHNICLIGDFNARTGDLNDFVCMNEKVLQANFVLSDLAKDYLSFPNYKIDELRTSKDPSTNNYGKEFVQLCQNLDVRIVNGRLGHESSLNTCKDASVVDYFATSPELFNSIISMKVRCFNPLLSDVHNVIDLHIHPSFMKCTSIEDVIQENFNDEILCKHRWSQDKAEEFVLKLDKDIISNVEVDLDKLLNNNKTNQVDVNSMNERVHELFSKAAADCNMTKFAKDIKHLDNGTKPHVHKKWFDYTCKSNRKEYQRSRNRYRFCKSRDNLDIMRKAGKKYKSSIKSAVRKYEKGFNKRLRLLRAANPKEFWKLLCTNDGKKSKSKIQVDVLEEYFANLNKDQNVYDDTEFQRSIDNSLFENEYLNVPFSEEEVMAVVQKLKSGKAAGPDFLIN